MEPTTSLITQGGFGIMAGVFLWLYLGERRDHKEDNKANALEIKELNKALQVAAEQSTRVLEGISEKIEASKRS